MTSDDEFASYSTSSVGGVTTVCSGYATSTFAAASFAGAGSTTNVRLTTAGTYTITANTTVNALLLAGNGITVSIAPSVTLTVDSGLVISAAGSGVAGQAGVDASAANTIAGGGILSLAASGSATAPYSEIITDRANTLTISSSITASTAINSGGKGTVILAGANTFQAELVIQEGATQIQNNAALGAANSSANVAWGTYVCWARSSRSARGSPSATNSSNAPAAASASRRSRRAAALPPSAP